MRDKLPQMMNQCQYMKAAKMALEKTTFHAIPWVLEDVPTLNKVNPAIQQKCYFTYENHVSDLCFIIFRFNVDTCFLLCIQLGKKIIN